MSRARKGEFKPVNEMQIVYKNNILQPLKGFCTIVEADCSFVEASRRLGLTPATLTKQVQALEKELGMDLFDRTSSKCLKLTEIGRKFYNTGVDVLAKMDNLVYSFRKKTCKESENVLRIGTTSFMLQKLIPVVAKFRDLNPGVKLEISSHRQKEGITLIKDGELDVFITNVERNQELNGNLEFVDLFDYVPYWILWKGHPLENKKELAKDDLLKCAMIYDDVNTTMKSLRAFYEDNEIKNIVNVNNIGLEVQKKFVKYKIGIWVIFNLFCERKDLEDFVFKRATNLFAVGKYGLLVNKFKKNITNSFTEFVKNNKTGIFDLEALR